MHMYIYFFDLLKKKKNFFCEKNKIFKYSDTLHVTSFCVYFAEK